MKVALRLKFGCGGGGGGMDAANSDNGLDGADSRPKMTLPHCESDSSKKVSALRIFLPAW
eukprot:15439363-Alexandrium_andersonii.AAC.1